MTRHSWAARSPAGASVEGVHGGIHSTGSAGSAGSAKSWTAASPLQARTEETRVASQNIAPSTIAEADSAQKAAAPKSPRSQRRRVGDRQQPSEEAPGSQASIKTGDVQQLTSALERAREQGLDDVVRKSKSDDRLAALEAERKRAEARLAEPGAAGRHVVEAAGKLAAVTSAVNAAAAAAAATAQEAVASREADAARRAASPKSPLRSEAARRAAAPKSPPRSPRHPFKRITEPRSEEALVSPLSGDALPAARNSSSLERSIHADSIVPTVDLESCLRSDVPQQEADRELDTKAAALAGAAEPLLGVAEASAGKRRGALWDAPSWKACAISATLLVLGVLCVYCGFELAADEQAAAEKAAAATGQVGKVPDYRWQLVPVFAMSMLALVCRQFIRRRAAAVA